MWITLQCVVLVPYHVCTIGLWIPEISTRSLHFVSKGYKLLFYKLFIYKSYQMIKAFVNFKKIPQYLHSILFKFSDHFLSALELNWRFENYYTILTTSYFSPCPLNGSLLLPIIELSFHLLKGDSIFLHLYLQCSLSIIHWISSPYFHHKFQFPADSQSMHLCLI